MLRAHTTGLLQPFAELLPGAMMSHAKIVGGHSKGSADLFGAFVAKIQPPDQFGVIRLERGNQHFHAAADDALFFGVWCGIHFLLQPFKRGLVCRPAPIQINDGMPQDAIEPRRHAFFIAQLIGRLKSLEHTVLHHIRRQMRIVDATAHEVGELLQLREQLFFKLMGVAQSVTGFAVLFELPIVVGQRREESSPD